MHYFWTNLIYIYTKIDKLLIHLYYATYNIVYMLKGNVHMDCVLLQWLIYSFISYSAAYGDIENAQFYNHYEILPLFGILFFEKIVQTTLF